MKLRYEVVEIQVNSGFGYRWVTGIPGPDSVLAGGDWHNEAGPATYSGRNYRYYLGNELIWKVRS